MDAVFGILLDSSVRSLMVAAAVAGTLMALRVKSPAILHRAWTAVLISILLLPALSLWFPRISLPVLPPAPEAMPTIAELRPGGEAPPVAGTFRTFDPFAAPEARAATPRALPLDQAVRSRPRLRSYEIAIFVYVAGMCVLAARLLVGMVLALRLCRSASRSGRIFHSAQCRVPFTVGLFRPRVLLPLEAQNWEPAKLEAVLAHEQEHVRRRDPLVEWLAMLNRCVYWFHPLSWWLRRRLTALAEQACDEAVLARGCEPAPYAELLLELARSVKKSGALVAVSGSPIDGSTLAVRIRRILTMGRIPEISRTRMAVTAVLCTCAILVPAFVTLVRAQVSLPYRPDFPARQNASMGKQVEGQATAAPDQSHDTGQTARPEKSPPANDNALFQTGMNLLQQKKFREAHDAFRMLIRNYPGSALEPDAYLAAGDSLQGEGGKENLLLAEDQFRNFIVFFPDNPKAPEAQLKIISILINQMHTPNPDRKEEQRAEAEIQKFLTLFPNSEYTAQVRQYLDEVRNWLQTETIPERYRKWLQEEVVYIISNEEKAVFLSLATDQQREKFIDMFWARRNPNPLIPSDQAKTELYRRLAYANEHFATKTIPGWKTDRGRIYILYGGPEGKEAHPYIGASFREFWQGGGATRVYPFERWRYDHLAGGGPAEFTFVDSRLDGSYLLEPAPESQVPSLLASALILAKEVRSVPPVFDGSTFGSATMKVTPNDTNEYSSSQHLIPYLQLSNPTIDRATNKPDLQISYIIKAGSRLVSAMEDTEGRTCHLFGKSVVVVSSIPLKNLESGNYTLYVKVLDRLTRRTLETSVDFSIKR
jgi:GWxTD domain-containing protein